jgi:hypothetical protein
MLRPTISQMTSATATEMVVMTQRGSGRRATGSGGASLAWWVSTTLAMVILPAA